MTRAYTDWKQFPVEHRISGKKVTYERTTVEKLPEGHYKIQHPQFKDAPATHDTTPLRLVARAHIAARCAELYAENPRLWEDVEPIVERSEMVYIPKGVRE